MLRITSQSVCVLGAICFTTFVNAQAPAAPSAPPAPVPRAKAVNLALAVEAAMAANATCTANGYKTTQLIVDAAGVPVVMLSGDGAAERTQTIAMSKVVIALRYNTSSGEIVERAKTDAALAAELAADPKIGTPRRGALLLKAGTETLGAIAVSGAPGGEKDEVCSQAAIDKIKDRLR